MDMTFAQLHEAHKTRLVEDKGDLSVQVLRNHLSVLNSYLAFCGKTTENRVGREFTIDFIKKSAEFVELACPENKKTASDRLSILRAWYKTVGGLNRTAQLKPPTGVSLFHQELRIAIAKTGESIPAIARAIHGMPETVRKWLNGAYPFKKGLPTFRRLEAYLGFERGYLENMLDYPRKEVNVTFQPGSDKFMARLKENVKDTYYLPYQAMTDELKAEWQKFLKYKSSEFPVGLKRNPRGRWRVIPREAASVSTLKNVLCHLGTDQVCTTAERTIAMLRSYFGFLSKPTTADKFPGLGMPQDEIQTLAMLAIPEFVNAYFEFVKARSGNITHAGHNNFGGFVASLTRPVEGYLIQQPAFFKKIEWCANGRTWAEICAETHELCTHWQNASKGNKSRDPKAPLLSLFALTDPLKPFMRAIRKLDEAAANCSPGSVFQATYKRDALFLAMAIANPLRSRTFTATKYIPPRVFSTFDTNLYRTEAGNWHLHFDKDYFKNGMGKPADYDAKLAKKLAPRIEEYLSEYRPVLTRRNPSCPWLFPNLKGEKHGDLGFIIANIAKNYIQEVARLRIHALRHIVATNYLRRQPGQYTNLAELLHDNLDTVIRTYAHCKTESAFNSHEESLNDFFDGI